VTKGTRVLLDGRLGVISGFYEEGGVCGWDVDMDEGALRWISQESAPARSWRWTVLTWMILPALGGFREVPGEAVCRASGRQRGAGPGCGP
jgi:hypothetical protein